MRLTYYLSSMMHLFVLLLVAAIGGAFLAFDYAPGLRQACYQVLQNDTSILTIIGLAIEGFALLLLLLFWLQYRRRFVTIRMSGCEAMVDESLIESYVKQYWKSNMKGSVRVVLHGDERIEVIANRLPFSLDDEGALSKLKGELGSLLAQRLGYTREFYLTLKA